MRIRKKTSDWSVSAALDARAQGKPLPSEPTTTMSEPLLIATGLFVEQDAFLGVDAVAALSRTP